MKIIHTADVHLGASPDMGYPWEAERSASLWHTFKKLIEKVKAEKADLLLISGDLFHYVPSVSELREVNYLFSLILEVPVVLCAGNHDHLGDGNPYAEFDWSANVYGLWERELSSVPIPEKDARVYGLSYYDNEAKQDLYVSARKEGREKYHILLLHGGDANHSPVKKERLMAMDFDYIAMGHIHKPGYVIKNKAVYSGALSPTDRLDTGKHGYVSVKISESGTAAEFIPFSAFEYSDVVVYSEETDSVYALESKIRKAIAEKGKDNSYRVIIKGYGRAAASLELNRLWESGHVLEIKDETSMPFDIDELCVKYKGTLLEKYIGALRGRTDEAGRYALVEGVRIILEAMEQDG
jgi:exonuclease SbcD